MTTLPARYYRTLEELGGSAVSAHVGGVGKDGNSALYKPLSQLFKEWDKSWRESGVKPKRKRKSTAL